MDATHCHEMNSSKKFKCHVVLLALLPTLVSSMETVIINGDLETEYHNTVNNSIQIIYQFNVSASDMVEMGGSHNALRAYTESDDINPEEPVTIVVKQRKGVLSWELPYVVGTDSFKFSYRTLCPYETIFQIRNNDLINRNDRK